MIFLKERVSISLLGCYWLTKQKNLNMQNAPRYSFDIKKKMSLVGISLIVLLLWNSMISLVDTVTGHVLSVPMDMDEQKLSIGWKMIMVAVFQL